MSSMTAQRKVGVQLALVAAGVLLLAAAIYGASYYRQYSETVAMTAEELPPTTVKVAEPPLHNFAMRAGDEYGYEPDVSEAQKQSGQVTAPLMMFRFAGERNGMYQIFHSNGNVRTVVDCEKPCEFVRARTFVNGHQTRVERVRRAEGSILYYAMDDAIHDRLSQHFSMKKGERLAVWYDD